MCSYIACVCSNQEMVKEEAEKPKSRDTVDLPAPTVANNKGETKSAANEATNKDSKACSVM